MITLPDFDKTFDYENNFYLSCDNSRLKKIIAHYELFKMALDVPGDIMEFGILKGCSLVRFAAFRELIRGKSNKRIVGFDSFGEFPETAFEPDKGLRERHITMCGDESISRDQLIEVLKHKGVYKDIDLIEGDITKTLPDYLKSHPDLKVSLINLDVDIYEPSKVILELLYPRLSKGGVLILDDYNFFPGETKAVNDYFKDKKVQVQYLSFCQSPCYVVKK
ncbi:MAG TPA: TylF/MycF/NovP-related O-methyltransferase [Candidatus Omnitrophota bacterium]|nr:TylF/MycF/NovP-related O-methyltransferase [Candidatus Omnitrophota bacterium]